MQYIDELKSRLVELYQLTPGAVVRQPTTLASGTASDFYIRGKLVSLQRDAAYIIASLFLHSLKENKWVVDAVGGPTTGADPLVAALVNNPMGPKRGFFVHNTLKPHGIVYRIDGPVEAGDRVLLVDDTVTTGGSLLESVKFCRGSGLEVVAAIAVVDRMQGAEESLSTVGVPYTALLNFRQVLGE